jgi:hypothetical protein
LNSTGWTGNQRRRIGGAVVARAEDIGKIRITVVVDLKSYI